MVKSETGWKKTLEHVDAPEVVSGFVKSNLIVKCSSSCLGEWFREVRFDCRMDDCLCEDFTVSCSRILSECLRRSGFTAET